MVRVPFISLALMLAVAACGGNDPVDKNAGKTAGLPDINAAAPSAIGEPHVATEPAKAATAAPAVSIPVALQGRWGLTPGDCMPGRADAKGLMVVSADLRQLVHQRLLRVQAARGVADKNGDTPRQPCVDGVETDGDSVSGNFTFTGEGQSWTKYEALEVAHGKLTRTETRPTASFTYAKCS